MTTRVRVVASRPWVVAAVMLAGCPRPQTTSSAPLPEREVETESGPSETGPEPAVAPCGPPDLRLGGYAWAPHAATVVASLDLRDAELDAALQQLAQTETSTGFPIDIAFAVRQWSWQVPWLVASLEDAGFVPAELAYVKATAPAWVFRSQCDLDEALAIAASTWGLEPRRTVEGVIAASSPSASLPFDMVFLPGERVAMVPIGRGHEALELARARPASETTVSLGPTLDTMASAPIRLVVRNRGLVEGGATLRGASLLRARVDAEGLHAQGRESTRGEEQPDGELQPP